ncbi:PLDc N-terminal domain-containing protein [Sinomonas sp. JGH33]|uniref:PLDc N-terminal domain-containing protein n=1 Tax=Sinomonas terricola TaxID=3110330 RepID=A0ABU5T2H1_9MICC|nr:PLDc N-terminal domain-containing protein [Sinomonas sp. JGH33]MEA5453732.1 PLDc N-terminal domain-containing protein [Sinomonas sp. JGH33]
MARLLPVIVILAAWLYAMVDCAMADRAAVRGLSKTSWFLITILPIIGTLLWFIFGRPRRTAPPTSGSTRGRRPVAPDDDPDFLRGL